MDSLEPVIGRGHGQRRGVDLSQRNAPRWVRDVPPFSASESEAERKVEYLLDSQEPAGMGIEFQDEAVSVPMFLGARNAPASLIVCDRFRANCSVVRSLQLRHKVGLA